MNILIEGRSLKTFLKENYIIALDKCYLLTKNMLNMELNMMFIMLMEFEYIKHSWTLQKIWWLLLVCNIIIVFFICIWEGDFLQALITSEYWEALE